MSTRSPMFAYVKLMNEAFGNPEGNAANFEPLEPMPGDRCILYSGQHWDRLRRQCENIGGKLRPGGHDGMTDGEINGEVLELLRAVEAHDVEGVRDGLADIIIFALGAYHMMGYDADLDLSAVLDGVMTRFCRNQDELEKTVSHWAAQGIVDVVTQGKFPRMCVKTASDQMSVHNEFCPKGKFLKSVGYRQPVFAPAVPKAPGETDPYTARRFFKGGAVDMAAATAPQRRKDDQQ